MSKIINIFTREQVVAEETAPAPDAFQPCYNYRDWEASPHKLDLIFVEAVLFRQDAEDIKPLVEYLRRRSEAAWIVYVAEQLMPLPGQEKTLRHFLEDAPLPAGGLDDEWLFQVDEDGDFHFFDTDSDRSFAHIECSLGREQAEALVRALIAVGARGTPSNLRMSA